MSEPVITHVSDTARWVAVYRAEESARPDAFFHDPFAERLAGARGKAMADAVKSHMNNGWPIIARTKVIDDLVLASLRDGCDLVLNLAAGLDTRPYRMALPRSLRWIEADLPAVIEEKEAFFAGVEPSCALSREAVDLADPQALSDLLDRATRGAERVLVITEGLLCYLTEDDVARIARALHARANVRHWIVEFPSPAIVRMTNDNLRTELANAPFVFGPENGVAFFESFGFRVRDVVGLLKQAARMRRLPGVLRLAALFPDPNVRSFGEQGRWVGVVRLER